MKYRLISWVEKRGFPLRIKKVKKNSFYIVNLDEFWQWAEKNRGLLDFSKLEENILGKEPEWVKEKRRLDRERNQRYKNKTIPWTKTEDEQLIFLLRQQKYTYHEISRRLRRTEGAILRRIIDLNIKDRPLRAKKQAWTEEKKGMLIQLIEKGYCYELIAEQLEYSSKAIRGFVYRMYGTENLDKVRKVLKDDNCK